MEEMDIMGMYMGGWMRAKFLGLEGVKHSMLLGLSDLESERKG